MKYSLLELMDDPSRYYSPAVFFMNGLGDAFLSLPTLRALAVAFEGRLTLICADGPQSFIFDDLDIRNRVSLHSWRDSEGRQFPVDSLLREVGACDLFISLAPWLSASLIDTIDKMNEATSIGFFARYAKTLEYDRTKHAAQAIFDIARVFRPALSICDVSYPVRYPVECTRHVARIRSLLPSGSRIIAVHADTRLPKMWPAERFTECLDRFLAKHTDFVAMVVGQAPQPLDSGIHGDHVILCYGLPWPLSVSIVAQADLFLGIDSCMLHAADMSRVPGVGLFGPSCAEEFGFRIAPSIMLQSDSAMNSITPEEVAAALDCALAGLNKSEIWRTALGKSRG